MAPRRKRYRDRPTVRRPVEFQVNVDIADSPGTHILAATAGNRLFLWKDKGKAEAKAEAGKCTTREVDKDQSATRAPYTCVKMSPCGRYLASGGEDKVVKLWKVHVEEEREKGNSEEEEEEELSCTCVWSATLPKRPNAFAFSPRSDFLYCGDKFGEVHCISVLDPKPKTAKEDDPSGKEKPAANGNDHKEKAMKTKTEAEDGSVFEAEATRLLAHFCSTITSVAVCPQHKFLATADRDRKVRVTCIPQALHAQGEEKGKSQPQAMHEIQSYCIGREGFASNMFFVTSDLLVTAGADGAITLWSAAEGKQVDSIQVEEGNLAGEEETSSSACLASWCYIEKKGLIVTLGESKKISAVHVNVEEKKLKLWDCQVGSLPTGFLPAKLALSPASLSGGSSSSSSSLCSFRIYVAGCVTGKEKEGKLPVSAVMHTLEMSVIQDKPATTTTCTATWMGEGEGALSPWANESARPLLMEDRKQYSKLRIVLPDLIKPLFPLDEREFRKRNTNANTKAKQQHQQQQHQQQRGVKE